MNRRVFLEAIGAAVGVSAGALMLPQVRGHVERAAQAEKDAHAGTVYLGQEGATLVTAGTVDPPLTWEWVSAATVTSRTARFDAGSVA